MKKESESYWKILRGECTLPEAMRIMGATEDVITESMNEIKERDTVHCYTYFNSSWLHQWLAYQKLVELGEISADEIFWQRDTPVHGDIGFNGNEMYRWNYDKA